jgi:hypothetical protein
MYFVIRVENGDCYVNEDLLQNDPDGEYLVEKDAATAYSLDEALKTVETIMLLDGDCTSEITLEKI